MKTRYQIVNTVFNQAQRERERERERNAKERRIEAHQNQHSKCNEIRQKQPIFKELTFQEPHSY